MAETMKELLKEMAHAAREIADRVDDGAPIEALRPALDEFRKGLEDLDRGRCTFYKQPAGFPISNPPRCALQAGHDEDHSP